MYVFSTTDFGAREMPNVKLNRVKEFGNFEMVLRFVDRNAPICTMDGDKF